jgi:two-component system chemotaxis sensor kinase CheA
MGTREEEFLKRLRATFRIEAEEHLQAMSTGLVALENLSGEAQTESCRKHFS